jgi:gliding motility-associated-like protein
VELCVTQDGWNGNAQGSNWFEGFGLTLGEGWESVVPVSPPSDADGDASGTWLWVDNVTSDATGITAGPGYFFEGPTGPTDGNPGNDWGDYCMMGDCIWNFCASLTVANVGVPLDLTIGVTPFADGSMGSWGTEMCFDPEFPIFGGTIGCLTAGCTDATACNYNPAADCDNGSCSFPDCIDPIACNFNPAALCDDGSCTYGGCTDPGACNFDILAGCDDGSCGYFSMGDITHNLIPCPDTTCTGSEVGYAVTGSQFSIYDWHLSGGGLVTTDQTSNCEILWGEIPGTYTITVQEITPQGCESTLKTCDVELVVPEIEISSSYRICYNQSANLSALPIGGIWTGDYVNGNVFVGSQPGVYWPEYLTNIYGCDVSKSIDVTVEPLYQAPNISYTKQELDLCLDSPSQRYVADDIRSFSYYWSIDNSLQSTDGNVFTVEWYDTTNTYVIGVYGIDEIGCQSSTQEISISTTSCERFYAPNSFTPNGDGINDVFRITALSAYYPKMTIFNRWGAPIYESSNLIWTGDSGTGYYPPTDTYNWVVKYRDRDGFNKEQSGIVTLIR